MKKLFLILIVLFVSTYADAQTEGVIHEIYFGYGFSPNISTSFNKSTNMGDSSKYRSENGKKSGVINIGYTYHLSEHFSMGLNYTYGTIKREIHVGSSLKLADLKNKYQTFMVTAKYDWLHAGDFLFYSKTALGARKVNKGDLDNAGDFVMAHIPLESEGGLAWQVTPIGIDWAFLKNVALFAEGGIGYCGYALAGVKFKF